MKKGQRKAKFSSTFRNGQTKRSNGNPEMKRKKCITSIDCHDDIPREFVDALFCRFSRVNQNSCDVIGKK